MRRFIRCGDTCVMSCGWSYTSQFHKVLYNMFVGDTELCRRKHRERVGCRCAYLCVVACVTKSTSFRACTYMRSLRLSCTCAL